MRASTRYGLHEYVQTVSPVGSREGMRVGADARAGSRRGALGMSR